jgi:hypothetical protein
MTLAENVFIKNPVPDNVVLQGKKIGSKNEWYVAQALDKLDLEYIYQYDASIYPGTRLLGSILIDFLVFTVPVLTYLFVDGKYWHKSAERRKIDELQRNQLAYRFGNKVASVSDEDTNTKEEAYVAVKKALYL